MKIVPQCPDIARSEVVSQKRSRWHLIAERDIRKTIERHRRLRILCTQAENFADCLPALPSAGILELLVQNLTTGLTADFRQEQDFLLTNFGSGQEAAPVRALIEQITGRLAAVLDRAADIAASLGPAIGDLLPPLADTQGYMLRSFFEGCRDTLTFVELAILSLGQRRLTAGARGILVASLESSVG